MVGGGGGGVVEKKGWLRPARRLVALMQRAATQL